jgi:hypothetical protein
MRALHKTFRATFKSWRTLLRESTDFATDIGEDRLISISHSSDMSEAMIVVWYWGTPEKCVHCDYNLTGNTTGLCPECGARA